MLKNKLLFLTICFFSINAALSDENSNISIDHAWISEAPPTVSVLAAYAHIYNHASEPLTLVSVSSPAFSKIELHLSKIVNDTATMEKQTSLSIPPETTLELIPGAYHLMLFQPDKLYKTGDSVILDFKFSDGSSVSVSATVKKRNSTDHEHHHHHHH